MRGDGRGILRLHAQRLDVIGPPPNRVIGVDYGDTGVGRRDAPSIPEWLESPALSV